MEKGDKWIPRNQSETHKTETASEASGATAKYNPDNVPVPSCAETAAVPRKPPRRTKPGTSTTNNDIFAFVVNTLDSETHIDTDTLTSLARSLLRADFNADQWSSLWGNEKFVEFINSCSGHPPAEMHVVSLLQTNETAHNLAPESVIARRITGVGFAAKEATMSSRNPISQTSTLASQMRGLNLKVTQKKYYKIVPIIKKPEIPEAELPRFTRTVFSYILQRVKMRGCYVLQPNRMSGIVRRQPLPDSKPKMKDLFGAKTTALAETKVKRPACPVSRLDCITYLLNNVESIVAKDLLQVMSQFPMAFPLILRNISGHGMYTLMTPLLRGIVVKWESGSGKIVEHSLFNDPCRLLVAVRLGHNRTGKSTLINQILAKDHTFSSRGEPGSHYGKPLTVDGSVEFVWLTEETCKDSLWKTVVSRYYRGEDNTITLLANLHGDANEHSDVIRLLSQCFCCHYLAFAMPNCDENQWLRFKALLPRASDVSAIRVDPKDYDASEVTHISMSCITEDETLQKVRNCLDEVLKECPVAKNINTNTLCASVCMVEGIETEISQKIIDFVAENKCKGTKQYLHLQVPKPVTQDAKQVSMNLHGVVKQFIQILQSPSAEMQRAVVHLENELSRLSNAETRNVRSNILSLKRDLNKAMANQQSGTRDIERLKRNITDMVNQAGNMNLGLEHFFREVSHLYELELSLRSNKDPLKLPQKVADIFVNGHPIELLDGDAGDIPMLWLNDILKGVNKRHPNLRVYVISIIGLQSSGKSTLLNSLFACRFAVSVGRCSRGLFMRLLFLDEKVAKACKVDAIILIDTEGLASTEKMNDVEADKKDRLLATFAMGMSNLSIINVLGENMKEIGEILQIAVVTMARLEEADISPDILLVQHLLTEKDAEKLYQSEQEFCHAISHALDLAKKKDVQMGVRNAKCLSELFARIQNGTLLTQFHPYKDGATANAPSSEAYHNDVVILYEKILGCCKASNSVIKFKKWQELLESYWQCVTQEDFALRFKNVKEIYDFIERGKRISQVKEAIDAAFSHHAREQKDIIDKDVKMLSLGREAFLQKLQKSIELIPHGCVVAGCKACKKACALQDALYEYVEGKSYETETQTTVAKFTLQVKETTVRKLSQTYDATVTQNCCSAEFDNIITRHLKQQLSKSHRDKFTESDRQRVTDEIFTKLRQAAEATDHDVPVREKIAAAIGTEYVEHPDMVKRFNKETVNFQDIVFRKKNVASHIPIVKIFFGDSRAKEIEFLETELHSLLTSMLEERKADCYEDGMVGQLRQMLTSKLSYSNATLSEKEKLNVQAWTLQQFCKKMESMQAEWDKKNKSSSVLKENKARYVKIIETRLKYGFSSAAEGEIIAERLLEAARQKAIEAASSARIRDVGDLVWTTNSEKVRLKYFTYLAEEICEDKKRGTRLRENNAALVYFENPQVSIEQWYKKSVDDHRSSSWETTFADTFKTEFSTVLRAIQNSSDSKKIVSFTEQYTMGLRSCYKQSPEFSPSDKKEDLEILRETVVKTMQKDKAEFATFEATSLSRPSEDRGVMSRLGCTARCYWCGALCWGQRGHDSNQDDTRKHHSSHQPSGLVGTSSHTTRHLLAEPCHDYLDEDPVHFGEYLDKGILWKHAKVQNFSNWKFDRHHNSRFDELMRWFFQELHESIASQYESLKPATPDDLKKYKCTGLSYHDIMARVKQEIN